MHTAKGRAQHAPPLTQVFINPRNPRNVIHPSRHGEGQGTDRTACCASDAHLPPIRARMLATKGRQYTLIPIIFYQIGQLPTLAGHRWQPCWGTGASTRPPPMTAPMQRPVKQLPAW
jgi:hypothetical protein